MPRKIITYHPRLTEYARDFRNNPTPSEALLWQRLKGKQLCGFDFHRQKPLGYYIVDFFCNELMLAIEIDGSVHNDDYNKIKDAQRQDQLEDLGIRFLRFSAKDIMNDVECVLKVIEEWIERNKNNSNLLTHP
jgi:very-short-patch-repair endonuclease